jgi:hypothetical protein
MKITKKPEQKARKRTVLGSLFEPVLGGKLSTAGSYDEASRTWSHREAIMLSPVKNNQEM